ncbi:hypothetical protein SAMN05444392_11630 [Seinonella peptonophila]|uniref:Helix-turn-helix n=1 Tax=Seinonella peptonophila TaxID=112248 RepID=A0A1M5AW55_9BACL|nr:hypothetical protein [Seinonella peptonophila]SHF34317.1 hypothetical protein SAMN05444392_11630 [Seinonella peptonophila]
MSLATLIFEQRIFNHLSENQLASIVQQPVNIIREWEEGISQPSLREILIMKVALKIPMELLLRNLSNEGAISDDFDIEDITFCLGDRKLSKEEEQKIVELVLDAIGVPDEYR